jgi:Ser/Thr protein kinase RdoA (MazF antagonist)
MSNSTAISLLKDALQNAYELGNIEAIESIATDEEEYLKAKGAPLPADVEELRSAFRVTSSSGSYFLKRVSSWVSDEQLKRVERFLKWSEEKLLSISPKLIEPVAGGGHCSFENQRYQLFEFVEQEKRQNWMNNQVSSTDCRLAGDLLLRMHEAFNSYVSFEQKSEDQQTWSQDVLEETIEKWKNLVSLLTKKEDALPQVFSELVQAESTLTTMLSKALDSASQGKIVFEGQTVKYLVHGDFHPGNFLIADSKGKSKVAWAIDFDHMHFSFPHFDLGYALVMFGHRKNDQQKTFIDWELVRAFLFGFAKSWYAWGVRDVSEGTQSEILEILQKCVKERINDDILPAHMTISCFLIIDWAADRFLNGPQAFAGLYEGIVSDMLQILMFEDFNKSADIYFETLKEILG